MSSSLENEFLSARERWDRLLRGLAAGPRRQIILSLMTVPKERRLSLPEAAQAPNLQTDSERLAVELRHNHLPMLAEEGYVRWSSDPFCVQRGSRFHEPASMIRIVLESRDDLSQTLWNESIDRNLPL